MSVQWTGNQYIENFKLTIIKNKNHSYTWSLENIKDKSMYVGHSITYSTIDVVIDDARKMINLLKGE